MKASTKIADLIPKAGLRHWLETHLIWSGVGMSGALAADVLDKQASVSYAAYYTNAVNDAVGYGFWILLSTMGFLLFCLSLPIIRLADYYPSARLAADKLRLFSYTFFLVAFDEGGLMLGILGANFFYSSEKISLLAAKSFLFSDIGIFSLLSLLGVNFMLWLLGESIHNRDDHNYSGVVKFIIDAPLKFSAPAYLAVSGIVAYWIIHQ